MSPFRLLVGVAAASLATPGWPQQAPLPPSNELLDLAIQNNRELQAVKVRVDEARALLRQAGLRPAPALEANAATGRPLGTVGEEQYGAAVSQTFETAGKRSLRIQVAAKLLALAEAEFDERLRQLRFDIRARWAAFAGESERFQTLDRLARTHEQSLDLMRARVEQGDAAALERDLLAVELGRALALRDASSGRLEAARADLARLAGAASPARVPAPPAIALPPTAFDLAQLTRSALATRPDLRAASLASLQSEAEVALARAQGKADVTLSAGFTRVYSRFDGLFGATPSGALMRLHDRDDILSVGVALPLFSRRRNLGNVEAAVARSRGAQLRLEFLERSVPLEVESALRRLVSARRAAQTLDGSVLRQSEQNLEVIRQAYRLGQLRLLDVLNEQRRLIDTQLAGIDARVDALLALADLEKAIGGELP